MAVDVETNQPIYYFQATRADFWADQSIQMRSRSSSRATLLTGR